jgi:hypothetical protein
VLPEVGGDGTVGLDVDVVRIICLGVASCTNTEGKILVQTIDTSAKWHID